MYRYVKEKWYFVTPRSERVFLVRYFLTGLFFSLQMNACAIFPTCHRLTKKLWNILKTVCLDEEEESGCSVTCCLFFLQLFLSSLWGFFSRFWYFDSYLLKKMHTKSLNEIDSRDKEPLSGWVLMRLSCLSVYKGYQAICTKGLVFEPLLPKSH